MDARHERAFRRGEGQTASSFLFFWRLFFGKEGGGEREREGGKLGKQRSPFEKNRKVTPERRKMFERRWRKRRRRRRRRRRRKVDRARKERDGRKLSSPEKVWKDWKDIVNGKERHHEKNTERPIKVELAKPKFIINHHIVTGTQVL